jgi:hypothetical protein
MNGETRKKLYQKIVKKDAEFCRGCGALPHERQLVIDHRDNDNSNNDLSNLQLLCRACNYQKNPRRPLEGVSESITKETELEKSKRTEPLFKAFVMHEINESENNTVLEQDLINSGAEEIGFSPVTGKRYLNKMCSSKGILRRISLRKKKFVTYKQGVW